MWRDLASVALGCLGCFFSVLCVGPALMKVVCRKDGVAMLVFRPFMFGVAMRSTCCVTVSLWVAEYAHNH